MHPTSMMGGEFIQEPQSGVPAAIQKRYFEVRVV